MNSEKKNKAPRAVRPSSQNTAAAALTGKSCGKPSADLMSNGYVLHEIIYDEAGTPWDYRILDVNPAFEQLTGFADKEVVGKTLRELMPDTDHHWIEIYSSIARTETPVTFEKYAAGLDKHLEITAMASPKNRFAVMFSEINRSDLGSDQQPFPRLSTLMNNLPGLAYQCLPEPPWTMGYVSPGASLLTGYQPEELLAGNPSYCDLVHPEDRQQVREAVLQEADGNRSFQVEYRIRTASGEEKWVREQGIRNGSRHHPAAIMEGLIIDITDRKILEKQFIQAQKMEAIGRLSGGVAHDFNNYLMTIIGYSEVLQEELAGNEEMLELLEEVIKAGQNATALIRQLLAFSRNQIFELEVMDLNEEIASLEKMLHRIIGEDIQITTFPAPDLKTVRADKIQMQQVIMNLAVNARDAMPRGGKFTIETANVSLDDAYARAHGVNLMPGPYVMLAVSDTGVGMDAETRQKIFEPFFTTKEKEKGTGLGLATIYGIIKQSNGYIWVYSEPDKGSTFKIYLPAAGAEKDRTEETLSPQAASPDIQGTRTILLVEDEVNVRTLLVRILQGYGYRVLETPDGQAAEALCRNQEEPIDLMITDMIMPGMNGKELAERIKSLRPEIKVLFMSGYSDSAVINHDLLDSTVNFIQKPIAPKVLAERVEEILSGG